MTNGTKNNGQVAVMATPPDPAEFSLTLLGGWEIRQGKAVRELPDSEQRLVAFVSLNHNVSRTYVAGTLWPEVSEQHARGSLRSTIWRLSRSCPGLLSSSDNSLAIPEAVTVDVRALRGLFAQMLTSTHDVDGSPTYGAEGASAFDIGSPPSWLWGDLLPGWSDDWVVLERERLRQMRVHALEALTRNLARQERFADALEVGMAAVGMAPLRESAHREVIRVHLAEGNFAEALRQYEVCTQLLRTDLGLEPSRLMIDLMRPVIGNGRRN